MQTATEMLDTELMSGAEFVGHVGGTLADWNICAGDWVQLFDGDDARGLLDREGGAGICAVGRQRRVQGGARLKRASIMALIEVEVPDTHSEEDVAARGEIHLRDAVNGIMTSLGEQYTRVEVLGARFLEGDES